MRKLRWTLVLAIALGAVSRAGSAPVTLEWKPGGATEADRDTAADITDSYTVYWKYSRFGGYGNDFATANPTVDCQDTDADGVHEVCQLTVDVGESKVAYFVATASNVVGESGVSNEAKKVFQGPPPPSDLRDKPGQGN